MDIENVGNSPITIGGRVALDFGSTNIEKLELLNNGQKVREASVTGDTKIYDNSVSIELTIGYQLNLYKK